MLACLSPNGMNRYDGASAPDRLLVATSSGGHNAGSRIVRRVA